MTERTIEVWGIKTFKTRIEVDAYTYDLIRDAGDRKDTASIKDLLTQQTSYDFSDTAVKLKRIEVDLYDEHNKLIATELELL